MMRRIAWQNIYFCIWNANGSFSLAFIFISLFLIKYNNVGTVTNSRSIQKRNLLRHLLKLPEKWTWFADSWQFAHIARYISIDTAHFRKNQIHGKYIFISDSLRAYGQMLNSRLDGYNILWTKSEKGEKILYGMFREDKLYGKAVTV